MTRPRPQIEIRRARPGDHAGAAALLREVDALHARISPGFFRLGAADGRAPPWLDRLAGSTSEALFVADEAGRLVGLVHVQLHDTPPSPERVPRRRLHLAEMVVARGHRRQGIGRRLIGEAEDWGRAHGARQLVLTVWAGNRAAERFYRALGFAVASRVLVREIS